MSESTDNQASAPEPMPTEVDARTDETSPAPDVTDGAATESTPAAAPEPATTDAPAPKDPETEAKPASASPTPKPRPRPGPPPAPGPRPASSSPAPQPVVAPNDAAAAKEAATFGRVDDDGTVFVREESGERMVGQFAAGTGDDPLALYVRRYLDLNAKVDLFDARLASTDLTIKEIDTTLERLRAETLEPSAVGNLAVLRTKVEALGGRADERRAEIAAERAAAKAVAVTERTQIVESAESIATTDPERMQWRPAGEKLRGLLDQWKSAQHDGPRIDRTIEEELWKRFSHARTAFDRERRHFFSELEERNAAAKLEKEQIVSEAEALAKNTDWGPTAGAYRDLMARWKSAGRAARRDDDALWARFRGAQDAFFGARDAANAEIDAEYGENLVVKEQILVEAEALVPVKDLEAAKTALRDVQDKWDAAGKVPRGDLQRVEARLRAVENAIRDADEARWKKSNPEQQARAEGAAAQLQDAIAGLEVDLAAASAKGNDRKVKEITAAIEARKSWLEQIVQAAEDSRG